MSRAKFKPDEIFGPQMLPKWLSINKTTNIFWRKAVDFPIKSGRLETELKSGRL